MAAILEFVFFIIGAILQLLIYAIIINAILSWLVAFDVINLRNQFVYNIARALEAITAPVMRPVQRPQRHQRDGRRAIRIGDDAFVVPQPLRVDLRNHERDFRVHAIMGALVDHETARFHRIRRQGARDRAAGGEKRHVDRGEHPGFGLLDRVGVARTADHLAHRPRRGEEPQRSHGEVAIVQEPKQLLTDGARRADDSDINGCVFHE